MQKSGRGGGFLSKIQMLVLLGAKLTSNGTMAGERHGRGWTSPFSIFAKIVSIRGFLKSIVYFLWQKVKVSDFCVKKGQLI